VILAIIGFFPTRGDGAIASPDWPKQERIKLAQASLGWKCAKCHSYNITALPTEDANETIEQYGEIAEIKIKNKEEQERDEAEKKRLEEQKSQCPTNPITSAEPLSQSPQPVESLSLSQHIQQLQPLPQNHAVPHMIGTPPHFRGEHIVHDEVGPHVQHQNQTGPSIGRVVIRLLDIFIVMVVFVLAGLIMKKFTTSQ